MPTETDPWERNAKLTGVPAEDLRAVAERLSGGGMVAVQVEIPVDADGKGRSPSINGFRPDGFAISVLAYDWIFSVRGDILKTPNYIAVSDESAVTVDPDDDGTARVEYGITVDPDAAPDLPSVDPHEHDDGWSDVAREVGVHEGTLRAKARRALRDHGDGATVSLGSDRGQWEFDAKTARMLKGPEKAETNDWVVCDYCGIMWGTTWTLGGDKVCTSDKHDHRPATLAERARYPFGGKMGQPYGGPHSTQPEKATVAEVERARSVLLRRIIDGDGLDVDEVETLAKAYDLLR